MEGNWGYLCSDHFGSEHVDEASTLRGTPFSDKLTLRRTYFLDVKWQLCITASVIARITQVYTVRYSVITRIPHFCPDHLVLHQQETYCLVEQPASTVVFHVSFKVIIVPFVANHSAKYVVPYTILCYLLSGNYWIWPRFLLLPSGNKWISPLLKGIYKSCINRSCSSIFRIYVQLPEGIT